MSSTSLDKFKLPAKYVGTEYNVWKEYIALAAEYKPLNLGQGFADFYPPPYVTSFLKEVAGELDSPLTHQYSRGFGLPRLVNALSKLYSQMVGKPLNPLTEILVTTGAYEALYVAIHGHTNPGDEVILIEPFFDCYDPMVRQAGGVPVYVPLRPVKKDGPITSGDWKLDPEELGRAFNKRTKAIILNTPHNPLGKVFTKSELELIAKLCKEWNVLCISDEVYEWMVFKPNVHVRIATLPGMWERTITIGSAGKTFSVTGWRTGWAYGPEHLIKNLCVLHQNIVNSNNTPMQETVARCFELELSRLGSPESFLNSLAEELIQKRDYVAKFLTEVGMRPVIPEGGYFIMADWSPLGNRANYDEEPDQNKDFRFTKWMTKNLLLLGIPPTAFYSPEHKFIAEDYVRLCFIKEDKNLQKAEKILKDWVQGNTRGSKL